MERSIITPEFVERALRVLLGLQPLRVNSTRSLLRSGLPAFGTTTAYLLRVLPAIHKMIAGMAR